MNLVVITYLGYLVVGILLTVWVAETLGRSGQVVLADAWPQAGALAKSQVHLLKVGYYLLTLGCLVLTIPTDKPVSVARDSIALFANKTGVQLLNLGWLLLCYLFVLYRIRRRAVRDGLQPLMVT